MELALYDPVHGYYTARISGVGPTADFSTTATLSPSLGRAIAAWIRTRPARHVIEVGAGTGALARAVLRGLPFLFRLRLRYHIVERSPVLRAVQQKVLGSRVTWHPDLPAALRATRGEASIFSNELADAFPVRIFRPTGKDSFEELFLGSVSGHLAESWLPAPDLPESSVFSHPWPPGQRLEVLESYHHWLAGWVPRWKRGSLLTIDYGDTPARIYDRRPGGSLRSYFQHELLTGPAAFGNPGRQDLTTDVNFDDLRHWGAQLGLQTIAYQTQSEFLRPHSRPTEADTFLTDPRGAGGAFKVLEQQKI